MKTVGTYPFYDLLYRIVNRCMWCGWLWIWVTIRDMVLTFNRIPTDFAQLGEVGLYKHFDWH